MKLKFNTELCTECHSCELMCSMAHYGVYNIKRSALRTITKFPKSPDMAYCRQCTDAPCVDACQFGALTEVDGVMILDGEKCVNCGLCQAACPYEAIFQLPEGDYFKCDTCQGEFKCTNSCVTGALIVYKGDN
jgi:Fe-S-cluster-containing hydrogenase component 2